MAKNVIGKCQLCFETKQLSKGHLFPKWSSRLSGKGDTYLTATGRMDEYSPTKKELHGPPTEYMFCEECDNNLGVGEWLLREIVHPSRNKPTYISGVKDFSIEIDNEEAIEQLCVSMGGLLLKAHLAKSEMLKDFLLTKKQWKLIFNGIKNSNLSKNTQITIYKIYSLENFKIGNFTDKRSGIHLVAPYAFQYPRTPRLTEHGTIHTAFVFGGLVLQIDIHPGGIKNCSTPPKSLIIPTVAIDLRYLIDETYGMSFGNISKLFNYTRVVGMMNYMKAIPLDTKCPCHVPFTNDKGIKENRDFGNCCYKYWGFDKKIAK